MALSPEEREKFLSEPRVAAFAVDAGDGRAPLTVPIWYQYAPPTIGTGPPPGTRQAAVHRSEPPPG
jgi:hypothetical protein